MRTTCRGLCALAEKAISLGHGLIPGRLSQDVLENWFGHQRQMGGCNTNMTGETCLHCLVMNWMKPHKFK